MFMKMNMQNMQNDGKDKDDEYIHHPCPFHHI